MRVRTAIILTLTGLASCAHRVEAPYEVYDEQSAGTLLVAGSPMVFARARSDVSAYANDFATLVALEIDISGDYRQFLVLYRWSTVDRRMLPPPNSAAGQLQIIADGRVIDMKPLETMPVSLVKRSELHVPNHGDIQSWAYKVDVPLLQFIATSRQISMRLPQEPLATPFRLREDGRAALAQFLTRAVAP